MKELAAIFADAGCMQVRTYIQSGNVLFDADTELARRIHNLVTNAVANTFGFEVPVLTRSVAELEEIVGENPFIGVTGDPKLLHVAFLQDEPTPAQIAELDPERSPPDQFAVRGRTIYLLYPNGAARSKLTNEYFDTRLKTTSTVRNWRTVMKLLEMAKSTL